MDVTHDIHAASEVTLTVTYKWQALQALGLTAHAARHRRRRAPYTMHNVQATPCSTPRVTVTPTHYIYYIIYNIIYARDRDRDEIRHT